MKSLQSIAFLHATALTLTSCGIHSETTQTKSLSMSDLQNFHQKQCPKKAVKLT